MTNGDKGGRGVKNLIFAVTSFLNGFFRFQYVGAFVYFVMLINLGKGYISNIHVGAGGSLF